MGSLSSQLPTVTDLWRDKVGPSAHFFGVIYGKSGKKIDLSTENEKLDFSLKIKNKTQHQITP